MISGCNTAALISRAGSIDWCCMPNFSAGSCFGRLLDWERGGSFEMAPQGDGFETSRQYLDGALVLEMYFRSGEGEARLLDCFAIDPNDTTKCRLLRAVEGIRGQVTFIGHIKPRFDYAEMKPWIRHKGERIYTITGGNDGLLCSGDFDLRPGDDHDLIAEATVRAGERWRICIEFVQPEWLDQATPLDANAFDRALETTIEWWRDWSARGQLDGPLGPGALRSALVLKGLTYQQTGAIVASPTTSLPESMGGNRNWDYRYSWIRDSVFTVRALNELGYHADASAFRQFVERSAAGSVANLQIMYGIDGSRRLSEADLTDLDGYRGSKPVRIGNAASGQTQLGVYGQLLEIAWRWHERGESPDDDYWRFLVEVVNAATTTWKEPDKGIWERRGEPQHFVHSKAACWAAADLGLRLAEECARRAPEREWEKARDQIRKAVETHGYDKDRGVFVQAFGSKEMDGSLLLLPKLGFVAYDDERMVRTTDAIMDELMEGGLVRRYKDADALDGKEGTFTACAFWLVDCLARQDRIELAREVFQRAVATSNDLGLFAEEYDVDAGEMLGNFPQGLSHLSHITAAVTLANI